MIGLSGNFNSSFKSGKYIRVYCNNLGKIMNKENTPKFP